MSQELPAPKVFISHASEDKQRFVEGFATKLREQGIDAWLDQWEISPGDDLPHRIFEEGIKSANVVIVVLSPHFVRKPWPKHELSASLIRRVYGEIKIIPVVIENCEIPQSLQSTLWVKIPNLSNYNVELKRVIRSIYDATDKPPLGRPPAYVSRLSNQAPLPGLSSLDTELLKYACELMLSTGNNLVPSNAVIKFAQELEISEDEVIDSIEILEDRYLVKPLKIMRRDISPFHVTIRGFETFARVFIPDFIALTDEILIAVVNNDMKDTKTLANQLSRSETMIDFILAVLDERRLIKTFRTGGGQIAILQVLPQGRRRAAELAERT